MGYFAIALAAFGFAVGTMYRLQVLLLLVALLLLFSAIFAVGSGMTFSNTVLTVMALQTVVQGSYFLGLVARAFLTSHGPRHIL
jgi:hypothetical protein